VGIHIADPELMCRSPVITGNETLTMVLSSGAIMEPIQVMSRIILMYDLVSSFMQFYDSHQLGLNS
jgi:hypothetical protein